MRTARREGNAAVVGEVSNGKEECVERVLLAAEREVDAAAWCRGGGVFLWWWCFFVVVVVVVVRSWRRLSYGKKSIKKKDAKKKGGGSWRFVAERGSLLMWQL